MFTSKSMIIVYKVHTCKSSFLSTKCVSTNSYTFPTRVQVCLQYTCIIVLDMRSQCHMGIKAKWWRHIIKHLQSYMYASYAWSVTHMYVCTQMQNMHTCAHVCRYAFMYFTCKTHENMDMHMWMHVNTWAHAHTFSNTDVHLK